MKIDKTAILLSFLIGTFAIGSWIDLNGVWVELPLLVNKLPEKWQLPTYIVSIVQIANIAPILYMSIHYCTKVKNTERIAIYMILLLGSICCALLAFFWDKITKIHTNNGVKEVSIAFFVLISFLSMVDTTSSVTFLPYLVNYNRCFITALYVGEGFSGLLPGVVGLIQGMGDEPYCVNMTSIINGTNFSVPSVISPQPKFTITEFFIFLCAMLVCCLIAFSLVDNLKIFDKYRLTNCLTLVNLERSNDTSTETKLCNDSMESETGNLNLLMDKSFTNYPNTNVALLEDSIYISILYIFLTGFINCLTNGVLPSIQNYTLIPYSNNLYHLVVTVSQILNPLACMLTLIKWNIRWPTFVCMTFIGTLGAGYLLFLAINSPKAFLGANLVGPILAAAVWFIVGVIFSFIKTMLAIKLQHRGHLWLQLCGASTQIGSALGALTTFILIGIYNLLTSKSVC